MNYMLMPGIKYKGFIPDSLRFGKAEGMISSVCKYFHVNFEKINVDSREETVRWPREVLMFFLKDTRILNCNEIAKLFSRHHTTVLSAVQRVKDLRDTNEFIKTEIQNIYQLIEKTN